MSPRPRPTPGRLLPAAAVLVAVLTAGGAPVTEPVPVPAAAVSPGTSGTESRAVRVLRDWDARRAAAWASGDPARLAVLYVPGSRTGRVDRAMLAAYADRGLRVTGLRMRLLAVEVLAADPGRLRLRVTDRLARAVARGPGTRVRLPRDRPTTRVVVLCRGPGGWRVVEVVPAQRSAAANTAATSRSAKE